MEITYTGIEGLVVVEPRVFQDARGYFFESFNQNAFSQKTGLTSPFVQDNESRSAKGVIRGLHFQKPPYEQGKLVRVIAGRVLDVAVDIRKDSPTYGQHVAMELSAENKKQFYVPPGFAHGFAVLEDDTIFAYKCTNYYHRESEMALRWNDPDLNIEWGINNPSLSEKDQSDSFSWNGFNSPF